MDAHRTDRPRLLVLDDVEGRIAAAPAMTRLRRLADVTVLDHSPDEQELATLAGVRVLMAIRERTRLDEAFFEHFPDLELVLQTGGHAYHLDEAAATRRGIVVALGRRATVPSSAVPELTFGLMIAVLRQLHPLSARMAAGDWPTPIGGTLAGRTLGILGLGRHGRRVARLGAALGMRVVAWDRRGRGGTDEDAELLPLEQLLRTANVVSVHLRLSPQSRGLLDRERLGLMRAGAVLVNTARGAIVDEDALVQALRSGRLGGAGLDVFAVEPLPADSPLRTLGNVILTPHIGWKVEEVFQEFAEIAADQLAAWLAGRLPIDEVLTPAAAQVPRERLGGLLQP